MLSLAYVFYMNNEVVPQPAVSQFKRAEYFRFTGETIIHALPFILFLYLYQPNVPHIYSELRIRTPEQMNKVLIRANSISATLFSLVGIFGYLVFADRIK